MAKQTISTRVESSDLPRIRAYAKLMGVKNVSGLLNYLLYLQINPKESLKSTQLEERVLEIASLTTQLKGSLVLFLRDSIRLIEENKKEGEEK